MTAGYYLNNFIRAKSETKRQRGARSCDLMPRHMAFGCVIPAQNVQKIERIFVPFAVHHVTLPLTKGDVSGFLRRPWPYIANGARVHNSSENVFVWN